MDKTLGPEDFDTSDEFLEYLLLMFWSDGRRAGIEHVKKILIDNEEAT